VSCRLAAVERSVPPSARRTFSVTHASPRVGVPSESAVITFPPVAMLREHSLSLLFLAIGQPYCEDCVVTRLHSSSHCRGLVSVTLKAKPRHGQDGIICSPPTPQRQKLQGAFIRAKTLRTVRFPLRKNLCTCHTSLDLHHLPPQRNAHRHVH